MTAHCPTEAARAPLESLASMRLRKQHRIIVAELVKAYPNPVRTWTLIDALHGDDPDGGPQDGSNAVASMIEHVRGRLRKYGWTIPPAKRGPGSSGYRLQPLEAKP